MARVTWRLLPFLLLLYIISWLDRVNVGFAKLQMNADLGLQRHRLRHRRRHFLSWVTALCEMPSNLLLVRFGARVWIARIMITWGLISAGMMFVQGTTSFYVLRFLLGAAEAGFLPGIIYYLSHWFPREHRAKRRVVVHDRHSAVAGVRRAAVGLAHAGSRRSTSGLHGWQWMFLLEGMPAVLLGFVVLGFLTEKPAEARWLTAEQRTWLSERIESEHQRGACASWLNLRAALTHPTVWLLADRDVLLPDRQLRPDVLGAVHRQGPVRILRIRGGLVLGHSVYRGGAGHGARGHELGSHRRALHARGHSVADRRGRVSSRWATCMSPVLAMLALSIAAAGDYCTRGPFWALPGKFLTGSAAAGAIALINSMGALGGFFGPSAVGWLKDHTGGFLAPMLMLSGVLVVGAILTLGCAAPRSSATEMGTFLVS